MRTENICLAHMTDEKCTQTSSSCTTGLAVFKGYNTPSLMDHWERSINIFPSLLDGLLIAIAHAINSTANKQTYVSQFIICGCSRLFFILQM